MEFSLGLKSHVFVSWLHPYEQLVVVWPFLISSPCIGILSALTTLLSLRKADVEYVEVTMAEPLRRECEHFADVVTGKALPLTDGIEA